MLSLKEALAENLSVVHYSFKFWCGFELFQFYFPLSYLFGAILSFIINPNLAFKAITLTGLLTLPPAFYVMGRLLRLSIFSALFASLLAVAFLSTEVHVMWGGNIFSTLAGMFANSWAYSLFAVAFGVLIRAWNEKKFSAWTVILVGLVPLAHFYGLLMLLVLLASCGIQDLWFLLWRRLKIIDLLPFYCSFVLGLLLLSWWFLPLIYYKPFSSEFGGNWHISLLSTLSLPEKIIFSISIMLVSVAAVFSAQRRNIARVALIFLVLNLLFFYSNRLFPSSAFIDARLWPTVYFSLYAITVIAADVFASILPGPGVSLVAAALFFLVPSVKTFDKAYDWYVWNYQGVEKRPGGEDFINLVQELNKLPPSRVSFESSDRNNGIFGTVRIFESLPYHTHHTIVEGGIVNSASYPGMGYFLQCLTSNTCAGWPPGTIAPGKDVKRAIDMMRVLGVNYHIATAEDSKEQFDAQPDLERIFKGKFINLYKLKQEATLVEVYEPPTPVLSSRKPDTVILNLPRWDTARRSLMAFDSPLVPFKSEGLPVDSVTLTNFLISAWDSGARVKDRAWEVAKPGGLRFLNSYLFSRNAKFDYEKAKGIGFEPFIADRGFDPDVYISNQQHGGSEVALPLKRASAGESSIHVNGRGYVMLVDEKEEPLGTDLRVNFAEKDKVGDSYYKFLRFRPNSEQYRYVETFALSPDVVNGVPGNSYVSLSAPITGKCSPSVSTSFGRIDLGTACPGKPHLLKFSYYPKWHANVPISLASNGFMLITPTSENTTLLHLPSLLDRLSLLLSLSALLALFLFCNQVTFSAFRHFVCSQSKS